MKKVDTEIFLLSQYFSFSLQFTGIHDLCVSSPSFSCLHCKKIKSYFSLSYSSAAILFQAALWAYVLEVFLLRFSNHKEERKSNCEIFAHTIRQKVEEKMESCQLKHSTEHFAIFVFLENVDRPI